MNRMIRVGGTGTEKMWGLCPSVMPRAMSGMLVALAILLAAACGGGDDTGNSGSMEGMPGMEGMEGQQTAPAGDMGGMPMDGSLRLTRGQIQTFGVTFGSAEVRPLSRTVRAVGAVGYDETRMARVAPKFGGWAERLHVDFVGRLVRAGEPLLDVYAPELVTAQEELLLAARMAEEVVGSRVEGVTSGASDLLASARRRLEYWDISPEQIDRILETGEVRRTLTLYAPTSGVVMEKNVVEGQAFQPGTSLYMIAGLSEVWVNAAMFESDAGLIRPGMPAEVTVAAIPGRTFTGRIDYVYPTLAEDTRSMSARVVLPNPDGTLKPGMYATVRLTADLGETLTVPTSAVLHTGERAVAFVDTDGGELMPHELELGVRAGDFVHVLSGVEPGMRVVTSAQFLLDSESNLAEVMQAMMMQMGTSDMGGMEGMDMNGMDMGGSGADMPGMDGMDMGPRDSVRPDSAGGR